jgi:hypothetical protein
LHISEFILRFKGTSKNSDLREFVRV